MTPVRWNDEMLDRLAENDVRLQSKLDALLALAAQQQENFNLMREESNARFDKMHEEIQEMQREVRAIWQRLDQESTN